RVATLLEGDFAAGTGRRGPAPERAPDPAAELRRSVGDALDAVLRLPDGRTVGVVRGECPPSAGDAVLLPAQAAEALERLGGASPLAGAEVLYRAPAGGRDDGSAARRALVAVAERKRAAAEALAAAGQPAEALALHRDALTFACRALDPRGDPGPEPAALLAAVHGHLVPAGVLDASIAAALSRAADAARAFDASTVAPPPTLVEAVAGDATALVARARAALDARHAG
ncbi:MAG TPA: hypothetical protein VFP65_22805, partial [Anaeromyxobacteraceae bacterium]|nr:hypothetical protein [Anaeromyxobacteraceae bacterium]